jgi:hypothetical protein
MLSLSWIIVVEILTIGKQQPGVPRGRPTNKERALRAAAKGVTVDVAAAAHLQTRAQVLWNLHQLCPRASIIYVYHGPGWNHVASRLFKLAGIRRVDSKSGPLFIDAMNWCCAMCMPANGVLLDTTSRSHLSTSCLPLSHPHARESALEQV